MKLIAERDALLAALTAAGRAATGRLSGTAPSIQLSVADNVLTATGSDMDLTIESSASVRSDDGIAELPARLVTDIMKSFDPGAVTMAIDDDEAVIASGRAAFTIRLVRSSGVPLRSFDADPTTLDVELFAEGLRQVVPAALKDDSRAPQLTGVCIVQTDTGIRLVATDSYRLAIKDIDGLKPGASYFAEQVLIPSRALTEVQRLLAGADELTIAYTDLDARFVVGDTTITTRLLRGPFPDYERLIPPSYPSAFTTDRQSLIAAIKRVGVMIAGTKDVTTPVRLSFADEQLTLDVQTAETGSVTERLDGTLNGDGGLVAFNPTYLIAGLEAATGDEVTLSFIDASKPATISGESDGYSYLIMPVRVS